MSGIHLTKHAQGDETVDINLNQYTTDSTD